MAKVSPLAPAEIAKLPPLGGVRLSTAAAGISYPGRTDVVLALLDAGTAVAGVLTRSRCPSAPVEWCREQLRGGRGRALVVNSGNANAFTGKAGRQGALATARAAAKVVGCGPGEVFLASTGVIGEPLDAAKVSRRARPRRGVRHADGWEAAARAIMTTDTFPKLATARRRGSARCACASTASPRAPA